MAGSHKRANTQNASGDNGRDAPARARQHQPFSSSAVQICDNADCWVGSSAAIVTPPQHGAFAVLFDPVPESGRPSQRYCLNIAALLHEGAVGIGILTKDEREPYQEALLRHKGAWQRLQLITPSIDAAGPVFVRNHSAAGPSRVQLRFLKAEPLADGSEPETSSEAPVLRQVRQVLTAAEALVPALEQARATRSDLVASWSQPLVRSVNELLAQFGRAAVNVHSDAIAGISDKLSDEMVIELAQSLAWLRPLGPAPNWTFGGFVTNPDLATHLRHSLWLAAKAREIERPIILDWYEGTHLQLFLRNDLSRTLFVGGCIEPNEFAFLDGVLQPGMVFVDGGANEGVYTVFASARVGPSGRVLAIEPSRRELALLRANLALNKITNVQVVERALAESEGMLALTITEDEHAGQNTLGSPIFAGVKSVDVELVGASKLDALVVEYALQQLDVLKLDIEGAELRTLQGAATTLAEFKPLLLFELSDAALRAQGGSASMVIDLLERAEYRLLRFEAATGRPCPVQVDRAALSDNMIAVHKQRDWGLPA